MRARRGEVTEEESKMNPECPGEVAGIGSEVHLKQLAQIRDSYRVGG